MLCMYDMNTETSQAFPIGFKILHQSLTGSSAECQLWLYFLRPLWLQNDLGIKWWSALIPDSRFPPSKEGKPRHGLGKCNGQPYLPLWDIPTERHLWKRQCWHLFRFFFWILQLRSHLSYTSFSRIVRRKKPCEMNIRFIKSTSLL